MTATTEPAISADIHTGIGELLESARRETARSVNALMTASYREIGRRIVEFEQGGAVRAGYGDSLIQHWAKDLSDRFGRGFSRQNIQQMRAFYLAWPAEQIYQTASDKSLYLAICQTVSGNSSLKAEGDI